MRIDLKLPPQHVAWQTLRDTVVEADRTEAFTGLWLFDHFSSVQTGPSTRPEPGPCFEGWTALSGLATITNSLRLGLMVSAMPYRHPAVLANMVSTIDTMSSGRLDVGLGAGNNADEAVAYGIDLLPPGPRISALEEGCDVLRLLLGPDDSVDYLGRHYQLRGARCAPKPIQPRVPFFIGGKGERRMLPLVARHADGWNYSNGTPEEFAAKLGVLRSCCKEIGRDPSEILPSVQIKVTAATQDAAREEAEAFVAAGARQILLYMSADPAHVGLAAALAADLRSSSLH